MAGGIFAYAHDNVQKPRWFGRSGHSCSSRAQGHSRYRVKVTHGIESMHRVKVTQGIESRIESPIESVTQSLKVSSQGHTQGIESRYRVKVTQGIESRELKVSRSVSVSQRFTTTTGTVSMAQNSIDRVAIVAEEPEKNGNHSRL